MPDDWSEFVEEYGPLVYRCAWRILRHRHESEDVVQDVFTSAWSDPKLHHVENLAGWLRRMTVCRSLDRLRKRKPQFSSELHLIPAESVSSEIELKELSQVVRNGVAALPDQQQLLFSLRYFEGMSNREIAEQLGVSSTAVSTALHAARQTLASVLAPILKGDD